MNKLLMALCSVLLFSCGKDSGSDQGAAVDYSGSYKGNINITVNGSPATGLTAYTIGVAQAGNTMTLSNNVFGASAGTMSTNTLTLTKKYVAISPTSNLVQYGTAVFAGSNMTIDFHEDEVRTSDNVVLNTKVWTGVLTKQ